MTNAQIKGFAFDGKLDQIARSHFSARPKHENPAWVHTHNDLGYVLSQLQYLRQAVLDALGDMAPVDQDITGLARQVRNMGTELRLRISEEKTDAA